MADGHEGATEQEETKDLATEGETQPEAPVTEKTEEVTEV